MNNKTTTQVDYYPCKLMVESMISKCFTWEDDYAQNVLLIAIGFKELIETKGRVSARLNGPYTKQHSE